MKMVLLCLLVAFPIGLSAQNKNVNTSDVWKVWSSTQKYAFMVGAVSGANTATVLAIGNLEFESGCRPLVIASVEWTINQTFRRMGIYGMIDSLNVFYSDARNKKIPFNDALGFIVQKEIGMEKKEADKLLQFYRELADTLVEKK